MSEAEKRSFSAGNDSVVGGVSKVCFDWFVLLPYHNVQLPNLETDGTINQSPRCNAYEKITYFKLCTLKILQSMSEFGGLCKHQNNSAFTETAGVSVEFEHHTEEM